MSQQEIAAEKAYVESVKLAFGAERRGWTTWEQEAALDAFDAEGGPRPPEEVAAEMDVARARRKADRNV